MTGNEEAVEVRIQARPEEIFPYLVEGDQYRRWQGFAATLDARPGGAFEVAMTPRSRVRGRFVAVEPPRRVVFTWGWEVGAERGPSGADPPPGIRETPPGSTTVEILLIPEGRETVVRLRHVGLGADAAGTHRAGWVGYVGRLATVVQGGDPGPEPLLAIYGA
ncbi:MAG: SRPBCC family protein [Methanobacteriota archaeon]